MNMDHLIQVRQFPMILDYPGGGRRRQYKNPNFLGEFPRDRECDLDAD